MSEMIANKPVAATAAAPAAATAVAPTNLDMVLDVPVSLSVELGTTQLPMKEVLELGEGSVIQLDKEADAPVELYVNSRLIARGEVVVVEDRFGIKITEIIGKTS
ncbi:MAG TPA: flagellar motor switch protein FliN [Verrucomicrobiales bacterium]|nr:flagellar motor switch protein FliN [Verrucomicrobiales bacterium]